MKEQQVQLIEATTNTTEKLLEQKLKTDVDTRKRESIRLK